MPNDDRTFKVGNDVYDIPGNEVSAFLKDNPRAVEVQSFIAGKDTFDIPVKDVDAFLKDMPNAKPLKKKDVSSPGASAISRSQSPSSSKGPVKPTGSIYTELGKEPLYSQTPVSDNQNKVSVTKPETGDIFKKYNIPTLEQGAKELQQNLSEQSETVQQVASPQKIDIAKQEEAKKNYDLEVKKAKEIISRGVQYSDGSIVDPAQFIYATEDQIEEVSKYLRDSGVYDRAVEEQIAAMKANSLKILGDREKVELAKEKRKDPLYAKSTEEEIQNSILNDAILQGFSYLSPGDQQLYALGKQIRTLETNTTKTHEQYVQLVEAKRKWGELRKSNEFLDWKTMRPVQSPTDKDIEFKNVVEKKKDLLSQISESEWGKIYLDAYSQLKAVENRYLERSGNPNAISTKAPQIGENIFGTRLSQDKELEQSSGSYETALWDAKSNFAAISKLLLTNQDPGSIEKNLGYYTGQFAESAINTILPRHMRENTPLHGTDYDYIVKIEKTLNDNIELTPEQSKFYQNTITDQVVSGAGGLVGFIVKMIPLNAAGKAIGVESAITSLAKGNNIQKISSFLLKSTVEEGKFAVAMGDEYKPGMGTGMAATGYLNTGWITLGSSKLATAIEPYLNASVKSAIGGTAGMEVGVTLETAADAMVKDKTLSYEMDKLFPDATEIVKRTIAELVMNAAFGLPHAKNYKEYAEYRKNLINVKEYFTKSLMEAEAEMVSKEEARLDELEKSDPLEAKVAPVAETSGEGFPTSKENAGVEKTTAVPSEVKTEAANEIVLAEKITEIENQRKGEIDALPTEGLKNAPVTLKLAQDKINAKYDAEIEKAKAELLPKEQPATENVAEGKVETETTKPKNLYTTKDGKTLTREASGEIALTNKKGEKIPAYNEKVIMEGKTKKIKREANKTYENALREYADNYDYTKGKRTSDLKNQEDFSQELGERPDPNEVDQWTIRNTESPAELVELYTRRLKNPEDYSIESEQSTKGSKEESIAFALSSNKGTIDESNFYRNNDKNNLKSEKGGHAPEAGMKKVYFAKAGYSGKKTTLDQIAMDASARNKTGQNENVDLDTITPGEVAEFMLKYPYGPEQYYGEVGRDPMKQSIINKFIELTGFSMTPTAIDRAIKQSKEFKQAQDEREFFEKNDALNGDPEKFSTFEQRELTNEEIDAYETFLNEKYGSKGSESGNEHRQGDTPAENEGKISTSPEKEKIRQDVREQIDLEVDERQKEIDLLQAKKNRKVNEYNKRNGLFGDKENGKKDELFEEVDSKVGKETKESLTNEEDLRISDLQKEIEQIKSSEEKRVSDQEKAQASQKDIFAEAPVGSEASSGKYAESKEPTISEQAKDSPKGIQFPELVHLLKSITGNTARVKALKEGLNGYFTRHGMDVTLSKELFKPGNEEQLAKTLAHEIGHLDEYMPEGWRDMKNAKAGPGILGKIANEVKVLKEYMAFKPGAEEPLTEIEKAELEHLAKAQAGNKVITKEVDEVIKKETGVTPEDVLSVWNDAESKIKESNPELYDYIARLSTNAKKVIIMEAMKGKTAAELKKFVTVTEEKTGRKITVEEIIKGDWKKEFESLLTKEIERRKLLSEKELYQELYNFSKEWRPFDEAADKKYTAYRKKASEVYADAISSILTEPETLKAKSPKFYDAWFNYLENKPEMQKAYLEAQRLMGGDLAEARLIRTKEAQKQGVEEHRKKQVRLAEEQKEIELKWFEKIIYQFISKSSPLIKQATKFNQIKRGKKLSRELSIQDRARNLIDKTHYVKSAVQAYIQETERNVLRHIPKLGITIGDFAAYMDYKRTVFDENMQGKAAPQGMQPEFASKEMELIRQKVRDFAGEEGVKQLEELDQTFHDINWQVIEEAHNMKFISDELYDSMKGNKDYYVTRFPVDKIADHEVSAIIKAAKGTLGSYENVITSTMNKMIVIKNAATFNAAKLGLMEISDGKYERVVPRKLAGGGWMDPPKAGYEILSVIEGGEIKKYYVTKELKDIFSNKWTSVAFLDWFASSTQFFQKMVTTYNPKFAFGTNVAKDLLRAYRNVAVITSSLDGRGKWAKVYEPLYQPLRVSKNLPLGFAAGIFHNTGKMPFWVTKSQALRVEDIVHRMRNSGALAESGILSAYDSNGKKDQKVANDMKRQVADDMRKAGENYEISMHEVIEGVSGGLMTQKNASKHIPALGDKLSSMQELSRMAWNIAKLPAKIYMGGAAGFESMTKVAGFEALDKYIPSDEAKGFYVRKYIGTPDWKEKGQYTRFTNTFMPFSNVMMQSLRSEVDLIKNPETRSSYFITSAMYLTPALMAGMAAAGVFGDDLKKWYDVAGDWAGGNYMSIPTGFDENGNATMFAIPMEDVNRYFYNMVYITTKGIATREGITGQELKNFLSQATEISPSLNPFLKAAFNWGVYMSGGDPFDSFRKRNVLSGYASENKGGAQANKEMITWTISQVGGDMFIKLFNHDPAKGETIELKYDLPTPAASFCKKSNAGITEDMDKIMKEEIKAKTKIGDDKYDLAKEISKQSYEDDVEPRGLDNWFKTKEREIKKQLLEEQYEYYKVDQQSFGKLSYKDREKIKSGVESDYQTIKDRVKMWHMGSENRPDSKLAMRIMSYKNMYGSEMAVRAVLLIKESNDGAYQEYLKYIKENKVESLIELQKTVKARRDR